MAIENRASPADWLCKIEEDYFTVDNHCKVFIYRKFYKYIQVLQPNNQIIEIQDGAKTDKIKPTMVIPLAALNAIVLALKANGIEPEPDSKLAGKLEATEKHLEDMRKIALKL